MDERHHLPVHAQQVEQRPRASAAVLAVVAALAAVALVVRSHPSAPPPDDRTGAPATVVALRPGPWLDAATSAHAVVAADGRAWVVDVDAGAVHELDLGDEASYAPVDAVVAGRWIADWGGRARAVPLDGGRPVDLGPVAEGAARPRAFRSERSGAVWVVTPATPATSTADDAVALTERSVDGHALRTSATTFPALDPPFAAGGGGLLVVARSRSRSAVQVVDPDTGDRRTLVDLGAGRSVIAADPTHVVVSAPPCEPSCHLDVVSTTTGATRRVPPAAGAGLRPAAGTVSPDGRHLVHVVGTTGAGDARPRYVVTDLVAGASRLTDVAAGPGVAWSTDSSTFVAAPGRVGGRGSDSRLVAHRVDTGETTELPVLVRVPLGTPWAVGG